MGLASAVAGFRSGVARNSYTKSRFTRGPREAHLGLRSSSELTVRSDDSIPAVPFRTSEPDLAQLLEQVHAGDFQLPAFQRDWIWSVDRIRALIASVSESFPIGVVTLLSVGPSGSPIGIRPFEGSGCEGAAPTHLVLDGQQRLSALYLALRTPGPVHCSNYQRSQKCNYWFYMDIVASLDPDVARDDAVLALRGYRGGENLSPRIDYAKKRFPLRILFDWESLASWRRGYEDYHQEDADSIAVFRQFEHRILTKILKYRVPVVDMSASTRLESVCTAFQRFNMYSVPLTMFEILTAKFAASEFDLRSDWSRRQLRMHTFPTLRNLDAMDFLRAVALQTCHQTQSTAVFGSQLIRLSVDEYRHAAPLIENAFIRMSRFLTSQNVFNARWVPSTAQLIPLSVVIVALGELFELEEVQQKMSQWYWVGVFSASSRISRIHNWMEDVADAMGWVSGSTSVRPRLMRDGLLGAMRLLTVRYKKGSVVKGFMALLLRNGCRDWMSNVTIDRMTFAELELELHHVFPLKYCKDIGHSELLAKSALNLAVLPARTNRALGSDAPSSYIARMEVELGSRRNLDETLATHIIDPQSIRDDNFFAFCRKRAAAVIGLVENATGCIVEGRDSEDIIHAFGRPV